MSNVALVTDSTALIPVELTKGYPIFSAPLQLIWGHETFRDSVDIHPKEFYQRLENAKVMPTTSQPSPAVFRDIYRGLLDQGYDILSVHISAKLSGTYASAVQARHDFPGANIEVMDSETTAMAMGFGVINAARAAVQGATLRECIKLVEQARSHNGILFAVSTLEYLRRGGRIGGAAAFLGTALNLKPILELRGGRIEAVERVRTWSKALDRVIDLFVEKVGDQRPIQLASLHANAQQEAQVLLDRVKERYGQDEIVETVMGEISPVLGTHTGPGCLGLVFVAGSKV